MREMGEGVLEKGIPMPRQQRGVGVRQLSKGGKKMQGRRKSMNQSREARENKKVKND